MRIARGCGIASVTIRRMRLGSIDAAAYVALAPQSWPTTIAVRSPSASISASASWPSVSVRPGSGGGSVNGINYLLADLFTSDRSRRHLGNQGASLHNSRRMG